MKERLVMCHRGLPRALDIEKRKKIVQTWRQSARYSGIPEKDQRLDCPFYVSAQQAGKVTKTKKMIIACSKVLKSKNYFVKMHFF